MSNNIPISELSNVTPGVLGTGGSPLSLNGLILVENVAVPIGAVQGFGSLIAVQNFFGVNSPEQALAAVYFNGFDNSNVKPGTLYFAQYAAAAVGAYLRGGSLAAMTLAQLQALTGTIIVPIDGITVTSASINLAGATSFSNAATLMTTGLGTGTVTWDAQRAAFVVHSPTSGATSTIGFATGTLSPSIFLQQAQGALLSQGSAASTPNGAMVLAQQTSQKWRGFMTAWEPVAADKTAFATWTNNQNLKYLYAGWDTDITATQSGNTTSFGVVTKTDNGVVPIWGPADKAAFFLGSMASIDFEETNGRITFAYKGQAGLTADVFDLDIARNLIANGYNFYGDYADSENDFQLFQPGQINGNWTWADPYVDQIYFSSQLALAGLELMIAMKSLPYNDSGYNAVRAAYLDPINEMLDFGGIRAGVPLSNAQAIEVNTAAGLKIDSILSTVGWYLQILPATVQSRGTRSAPPSTLWYTDGGSIQHLNLNAINVQ
jgi:hypothetical protein